MASPRAIATERGISQQGKRCEARFGSVRAGDSASTPIDRASPVGLQAARGRGLRSRAWVTLLLQRAAWGRAGGRDDARQGALPSVAWPSSTLTAGTTVLRRCGRAIPGPCSDGDDAADAGGPGSCPRCGRCHARPSNTQGLRRISRVFSGARVQPLATAGQVQRTPRPAPAPRVVRVLGRASSAANAVAGTAEPLAAHARRGALAHNSAAPNSMCLSRLAPGLNEPHPRGTPQAWGL